MATPAKIDTKPVCKYGANCYRKNEQHLKQYRHPKRAQEDEEDDPPKKKKIETVTPKGKVGTIEKYFVKKTDADREEEDAAAGTSKTAVDPGKGSDKSSDDNENDEEPAEEMNDDDDDDGNSEEEDDVPLPASPMDIRKNIQQKFLVEMPEDFYDFWKLCKKLNSDDPLDALQETMGFTLVGPFDVLAGRHKDVERNSAGHRPNFLLHWRFYYDPPEFITVIKGDDKKQFHLGYFRDAPNEMPVFVAANCAKENGNITPKGENLFAAVSFYVSEKLKDKSISSSAKKSLQELQESIKSAAEDGGYSLELKTKGMKERDKKVVCKTFHGAGLVVPVDENEVGYRPVPETPSDLKKMFIKIRDSKTKEERDKNLEPLQEIITFIQFANDECDYGEGIELGLDLFTFGAKCFHSPISFLLPLGYQLVHRPEFSKILQAHLKKRSDSSNLSQID